MPKCVVCGREATPTTYIDGLPYCLECSRKIDDMIDRAISSCLEEYLSTGRVTKIDKVMPSDEELKKFKLRKNRIRRIILTRVVSAISGRH